MKKIIKKLLSFSVTLMLIASFCLVVHAWTPPKLKSEYVEPEVQFRSVWVCTVSNMDIKPQIGTDENAIETWKKAYLEILDNSVKNGMNAIIFQVSPCNDAFYPSKYRPWSEYLAGFGVDPGWDPVEWMIEVTHERDMYFQCWMNAFRVTVQEQFPDNDASAYSHDELIARKKAAIENLSEKYVDELSGGERQKAFLALMLAQNTDMLILDEPTTYLDLINEKEFLELIILLKKNYGKTILIVMHNLNNALNYSDDLIFLDKGKLICSGDKKDVINSHLIESIFKITIKEIDDKYIMI